MSSSPILNLPSELVQRICRYVCHELPSSVAAFACTSRSCYMLSTPILFRTLSFPVLTDAKLQGMHRDIVTGSSAPAVSAMFDVWKSVTRMRRRRCPIQFPRSLLESLHEYRPHCRLDISHFPLLSLNDPVLDPYELMLVTLPYLYNIKFEYQSFNGSVLGRNGLPLPRYDIATRMILGMAQNLKEIELIRQKISDNDIGEWPSTQTRSWERTKLGNPSERPLRGSLRFLGHSGRGTIAKQVAKDWKTATDLSILKELMLESAIEQDVLELLADITFNSLRALTIRLTRKMLINGSTNEYFSIADRFLENLPLLPMLRLPGDIPPVLHPLLHRQGSTLRQLSIQTEDRQPLSANAVSQVVTNCPMLEGLQLTIPRTKGNAAEVSLYKVIGSIQRLHYLFLYLDASNSVLERNEDEVITSPNGRRKWPKAWSDPSFDDFDQQFFVLPSQRRHPRNGRRNPRNGHIRDAFINCAMDETLARSIFEMVSSGKTPGARLLEELDVEVVGYGNFGRDGHPTDEFEFLLQSLSLQCYVKRNIKEGFRDKLDVVEEQNRKMEYMLRTQAWTINQWTLKSPYKEVFRRIWPAKGEGYEADIRWFNDWKSFPLGTSKNEEECLQTP